MAATVQTTVERTSDSPHLRVGERFRLLIAHREILLNLVRKELKVKYAASVLGAIWSLLNPLVYLAVFSFVAKVLGGGIPNYPVYLLSGLLAWNLFSSAMNTGARAILDNSNLVKKVSFPHEILPLSSVGVALVDFVLQSAVLILVIAVVPSYTFQLSGLALWPLAFVTLLVLTSALSLGFSALNVRYRDVGHLLNIALLVWFWSTPIVYAAWEVQDLLRDRTALFTAYLVNPMVGIVAGFQRAFYGAPTPPPPSGSEHPVLFTEPLLWYAMVLGIVLLVSLVVLRLAWGYFFSRSGDFAEEL